MRQRMGIFLEVAQSQKKAENKVKTTLNGRDAIYHYGQSEAYKIILTRLPIFLRIAFHAGFSFSEGIPEYENGETEEGAYAAFLESEKK